LGLIADSVGRGLRITDSSKTYVATYDVSTTAANIGTNQAIPLVFNTVAIARMAIDTSGRVGIGTNSPAQLLELSNSSGPVIRLTNTTASAQANDTIGKLEYYSNDADGAHVGAYVSAIQDPVDIYGRVTALTFGTNTFSTAVAERMRINYNGDLLVGTTTAEARFTIGGTSASAANTTLCIIGNTDYTTSTVLSVAPGVINFDAPGVVGGRFKINSSGNIFFPSIRAAAGTYAAKITAGTAELTFDTSSARYKDNIRDSDYGLEAIMALRSAMFEYKSEPNRTDIGLIAEEVYEVVPELVAVNSDGEKDAVNYDRFVSVCIKAIQEQQALIETLTQRITALEGR
jgi:hypothetical protein